MEQPWVILDGNEAAASVAYRLNEVVCIYPITPSSAMGEWCDQWAAEHRTNLWGSVPAVVEMQSEGGAAGAVHGALQTGSLTTTFTASQGLLLMVPNLFKIAGELTAAVFHVSARSIATHALSIFGDHSDVMAARSCGWAMLCSGSVQEAQDFALVAQAATLRSRIPFLHFFDGFRTSHEVMKIRPLADEDLRALIDEGLIEAHRARALSPEHPFIRGTAQNPDVFFQAREACNRFYDACPAIVQEVMSQFAERTGRRYGLFDYSGAPDATRVVVAMGSGAETAEETALALNETGEKVGVVKVRLFRPFSGEHLLAALPATTRSIAVLDRTKEPGAAGEPLFLDVVTAVAEGVARGLAPFAAMPRIIGGRYGLSSKEFTPAMAAAVFHELGQHERRSHFTVGITDDVTGLSLPVDPDFSIESPETVRALFYGLGADGTVSANKNSIKIIGEETDLYAQGYFVYDSKKSGSMTVSHLRFGPKPIHASYLIREASFVACHQFSFLERLDVLASAKPGATFLLNSPYAAEEVWDKLPRTVQQHIVGKKLRFFVLDAEQVARDTGMGSRVNTILQTAFFALSGVLPVDEAIAAIKHAVEKTYGRRGAAVVRQNFSAIDHALAHLHEVRVPETVTSPFDLRPPVPEDAPEFVRNVTGMMVAGRGDELPVSAMPVDGTFPSATTQWEKRNIALEIPVWDPNLCIQCGKCVLVCPHATIRAKLCVPEALGAAPEGFMSAPARWKDAGSLRYTLQVAPEDCTGCTLCVEVCPAKDKREARHKAINMQPVEPLRETQRGNWSFFLDLPEADRRELHLTQVKDVQLLRPLFEFSGACSGCGETPYVKLLSQLFGDRLLVANATGCSSIYGGNLPTTPWAVNAEGRGPAWSNSLFEDNAEFGLGMRLTVDAQEERARRLLGELRGLVGEELAGALLQTDQSTEEGIAAQRTRVAELRRVLAGSDLLAARDLAGLADSLLKKSVWIVGGDGWAYDIGYGGLDHVLASGRNVKLLVLDTEVYSNTGGQMSKATPRAAVAKFAAAGKPLAKKDLALLAMAYANVYVARVAMGASDTQTVKAFLEAEAYQGPSLIIAYSHCIAHGYDMRHGMQHQAAAVQSGHWPLFRFDPRRSDLGQNPLALDSKPPSLPLAEYAYSETRYRMLAASEPEEARRLLGLAEQDVRVRWRMYEQLAAMQYAAAGNGGKEHD
jgi:pyruvate-ferredoxin/flavodoxin oxidoreductase